VKKILALAVALVLCLGASAFAIQAEIPADTTAAIAKGGTQITIGGELRFRGSNYQNITDFNKSVSTSGAYPTATERQVFESRIRLSVEAKVSPNTIGFIELEGAGGAGATGENTNWGSTSGTNNSYGTFKFGEDKVAPIQVKQAWIQHSGSGLFGVPTYVKVGHQPVTIGAGVFYKHNIYGDDAILAGITPIKGLDLTAAYVKLREGAVASADDIDLYSAIITYAINKDIAIGADVSLLDIQNSAIAQGWKTKLYNIGLNAKAAIAGFKLKGSVDIQAGTLDDAIAGTWYGKSTYTGLAATAGAAYTFAPVTLALDLGYGSGDNTANKKFSTFMTAQGHNMSQPGTFIYEYLTPNAAGNTSGGLQNTVYGKISASADVVKDLNIGSSITFLKSAKKAIGDGGYLQAFNPATSITSSSYIGTEIDLNASYQIDKGLKYFVEGGYLFAGNFWKVPVTGSSSGKISDPWGIRHGIQLNF
jgi:hypothetical protein